ncbi:hypothetical protein BDW59DRAFT_143811 [Aspergillus cavernicola]|uniref:Uncharacterized protein n=1 Tax=Aspergillus cavernicola TaxID=176166 RepID=A0ABR4IJ20_9EURO
MGVGSDTREALHTCTMEYIRESGYARECWNALETWYTHGAAYSMWCGMLKWLTLRLCAMTVWIGCAFLCVSRPSEIALQKPIDILILGCLRHSGPYAGTW